MIDSQSPEPAEVGMNKASDYGIELNALTFDSIVDEHSAFARNIARRILHDEHDVDEAVQDAFLSAYRAFPNFKGKSKVSTWLYRIIVNACLLKIRYNKRHLKHITSYAREHTGVEYPSSSATRTSDSPEKMALNSELCEELKRKLELLSPEVHSAILLRDVHGYSTEEASQILGISPSALKSRLHRGRTLLREWLEEYSHVVSAI